MASGLVASLIVIAVGAILDFAVTVSPNQHGFNVNTVGVILLIIGIIGAIASIALFGWGSGPTSTPDADRRRPRQRRAPGGHLPVVRAQIDPLEGLPLVACPRQPSRHGRWGQAAVWGSTGTRRRQGSRAGCGRGHGQTPRRWSPPAGPQEGAAAGVESAPLPHRPSQLPTEFRHSTHPGHVPGDQGPLGPSASPWCSGKSTLTRCSGRRSPCSATARNTARSASVRGGGAIVRG